MERRLRHQGNNRALDGRDPGGRLAPSPASRALPAGRRLDPTRACHQRPYAYEENGERRTRTADTTIFSRVLYQLSYLAESPAISHFPRRAIPGQSGSVDPLVDPFGAEEVAEVCANSKDMACTLPARPGGSAPSLVALDRPPVGPRDHCDACPAAGRDHASAGSRFVGDVRYASGCGSRDVAWHHFGWRKRMSPGGSFGSSRCKRRRMSAIRRCWCWK
jgi:hypothetical protein